MNKKDWRQDISDHDTLYDLDPVEVMVFMRHQYLETAKDLLDSKDMDEYNMAIYSCKVAELMEEAIEIQFENYTTVLLNMEPSESYYNG